MHGVASGGVTASQLEGSQCDRELFGWTSACSLCISGKCFLPSPRNTAVGRLANSYLPLGVIDCVNIRENAACIFGFISSGIKRLLYSHL